MEMVLLWVLSDSDGTKDLIDIALVAAEPILRPAPMTVKASTVRTALESLQDAAGSMHVLFPLAGLRRANPLPQGEGVLPGEQDGRALSWQVSSEGGREEFVVVLADAPLARLEERLAALDAAAIDAPQRGVARISSEPLANVSVQGRQLAALLSAASAELADARHVRVLAYHFETRTSR